MLAHRCPHRTRRKHLQYHKARDQHHPRRLPQDRIALTKRRSTLAISRRATIDMCAHPAGDEVVDCLLIGHQRRPIWSWIFFRHGILENAQHHVVDFKHGHDSEAAVDDGPPGLAVDYDIRADGSEEEQENQGVREDVQSEVTGPGSRELLRTPVCSKNWTSEFGATRANGETYTQHL